MKIIKGLGWALLALALMVAGLLTYVRYALPKVAPADPSLTVEITPQRVARGKYLAEHASGCLGCHSQEDWRVQGRPVRPGTEFEGGDGIFSEKLGLPGSFPPPNLTPYHLSA